MRKIFKVAAAIFSMWLAGGCASRAAMHRAIPGCGSAQAFVPAGCYSIVQGEKIEVRCPGQTSTYHCGKKI
jgi:hypothetical protein